MSPVAPRTTCASVLQPVSSLWSRRRDKPSTTSSKRLRLARGAVWAACGEAGPKAAARREPPPGRPPAKGKRGPAWRPVKPLRPRRACTYLRPPRPAERSGSHRSAPLPFIRSYINRAFYLPLGIVATDGSQEAYKALLTIRCCETLCIM